MDLRPDSPAGSFSSISVDPPSWCTTLAAADVRSMPVPEKATLEILTGSPISWIR